MPRIKYPEIKSVKLTSKVERTEVSFQRITEHSLMNKLIKPLHQGAMQEIKVNEMVAEYLENPHYWTHKQIVTISILNDSYYITDGQHRIEASRILYLHHNKCGDQDCLLFNWHVVNDENEMRLLYNSINKDSTKNEIFVSQDIIKQVRAENFSKFMKNNYKDLFPNKKNNVNKRYTIESFRDELIKRDFFNREKHKETNIFLDFSENETYENFIIRSASEYFNVYDYQKYISEDQLESLFYADEIKFIKQKQVFTLIRNNFLDWIKDKTLRPRHSVKIPRSSIPSSIRNAVWKNEFGENTNGKCPITTCCNIITSNQWHCGHIISHYNGGENKIGNLRPICSECNYDMGSKNWSDYESIIKEYS